MNRDFFIIFLIISFIVHISLIIYLKPNFLIFSQNQNLNLKQDITKIDLIKIKQSPPPKPEVKEEPKVEEKKEEPKPIVKEEPKPEVKEPEPIKKEEPKPEVKEPEPIKKEEPKPEVKKPEPKKEEPKPEVKKDVKVAPTPKEPKKVEKKVDPKAEEKTIKESLKKKIEIMKKMESKKQEIQKKLENEMAKRVEMEKEAAAFYSNKIVGLIQSLWVFPDIIKDSELSNLKIVVKLKISKNGKIIGTPVVIDKSGNEIFNDSALRAIEKLNNYNIPLPDIIRDNYMDLTITLTPPND